MLSTSSELQCRLVRFEVEDVGYLLTDAGGGAGYDVDFGAEVGDGVLGEGGWGREELSDLVSHWEFYLIEKYERGSEKKL